MENNEAKDPICGMTVIKENSKNKGLFILKDSKENYFCSNKCKDKFNKNVPWYQSDTFGKVFPYFLAGILIIGTITSILFNFMILYMGIFFIVFSLFKMPAWRGFTQAFKEYDLIAKYIPFYAWIYPAIELILGIMFIINFYIPLYLVVISWITLIMLGIGGIGVTIKILKKEKFQCACLGTWINVPLTKVTLLEDILMVIMAIILLV